MCAVVPPLIGHARLVHLLLCDAVYREGAVAAAGAALARAGASQIIPGLFVALEAAAAGPATSDASFSAPW